MMENLYTFTERMAELFQLLKDRRSREIFWARLQYDCAPGFRNDTRLYQTIDADLQSEAEQAVRFHFRELSEAARREGKKLFLYGAAMSGRTIGSFFLQEGDFFAYCARNPEKYPDGVNGKPVLPPERLFQDPKNCYVIISSASGETTAEILALLAEHDFPKEHIWLYVDPEAYEKRDKQQYFEFPQYYAGGKAFIDAGCYHCETSVRFAEWCGDDYSKIIAFEPDPSNFQKCREAAKSAGLRIELIQAGLSDRTGEIRFSANGTMGSFALSEDGRAGNGAFSSGVADTVKQECAIRAVRLDEIVQETEVGFMKMDIEGAELAALHGAAGTIARDKPLLAVCVYHRKGDLLAVMDYLHTIVPEYRFRLRHYGVMGYDTILYASAEPAQNDAGRGFHG